MKISFSVDSRPECRGRGLARRRERRAARRRRARLGARAAMRILSAMSSASACSPSATPSLGLATKSTAPSSSARKVTSAPRSVSVETISTGIGRSRISLPRKSMPSMRGISTSSVITSGLRLRIISRAAKGSARRADALHVGLPVDDLGRAGCAPAPSRRPPPRASWSGSMASAWGLQKRTMAPAGAAARAAAARSCASTAPACVDVRRLTSARPLAGRKQTLRGWMSSTSFDTTGMRSVRR